MKFVRGIAVVIGLFVAGVIAVAVVARNSDGPIGPFPGGSLIAGELVDEWTPDWSFAATVPEVDLQLFDPDRSRRTWILVHDGAAYIPCGLPNASLWKQWPHQAVADGRALVRIEAKRYIADLLRIEDADLVEKLGRNLEAKYGRGFEGETWYFRLIEPAAD
jgi:hypothetical protein